MPRLHLLRSSYDLFVYDIPYDFFGIVGGNKLRRMCLHCLRSPYDFFGDKLGQNLTARLSHNHRVIFTTSLYKSHDVHTITLRKSQGVGTLTVQLSCSYVHGFKRPSMFIFGLHLNCVSKSCDHKSCYEEASVFSCTWSQRMEQRDTFVYILMSSHRILQQPLFYISLL